MKTNGKKSLLHALTIAAFTLSACNGQAQQPKGGNAGSDTSRVGMDLPHTEVQVNKHYDEQGNLIAFDSTYSSFYSTHSTDPAIMDSLFHDLRPRFNSRFPFMTDPGFNDLFFRDSLLYPDFFHDDFFRKRMEMNERWMQKMLSEMDSMKNSYFQERAHGKGPPKEKVQ